MEICQHIFSELHWIVCPTYLNFWLNMALLPLTELFLGFPYMPSPSPILQVVGCRTKFVQVTRDAPRNLRHGCLVENGLPDLFWSFCTPENWIISKTNILPLRIGRTWCTWYYIYLTICDSCTLLWRIHKWFLLNVTLKRKSEHLWIVGKSAAWWPIFVWRRWSILSHDKNIQKLLLTVEKCHWNSE